MKAIGFFFAVFLSMLAVFLVATGEVTRWLSPGESIESLLPETAKEGDKRENYFDFEYWDPREGRLRFVVRAELNQETLHGGDPLDKLKQISLRDGIIELPLDRSRDRQGAPEDLVLHFAHAVYHKGGDTMGADAPLYVDLRDGRAVSSEGTEFLFEDLHFVQKEDDRGKFDIHTEHPVLIRRPQHLEVRSAAGLRGVISGDGGFEYLTFLPPVTTLIQPGLFDPLHASASAPESTPGGSPGDSPASARTEESEQPVAIVCRKDLEIDFHAPLLWKDDPAQTSDERMRITFAEDVELFRLEEDLPKEGVPVPKGNVFQCQKLELEIDTSTGRPVPRYAVATWEGDRVKARFVHGRDQNTLRGEILQWFNRAPLAVESSGELPEDPDQLIHGEAVLSGAPELVGEDFVLRADRATMHPDADHLVLEQARGELARRKSAAEKRSESRELRADSPGSSPSSRGTNASSIDRLDFISDTVDVHFRRAADEGGAKALDRFVARSAMPRGVIVEGRRLGEQNEDAEASSDAVFRAESHRLIYDEAARRITLEGTPNVLPRLSFGPSWIEAEVARFSPDEERATFDGRVWAHFERSDEAPGGASTGEPRTTPAASETPELPELLELSAHSLVVERDGDKWKSAVARGAPGEPVVITAVLESGGESYRFRAPEAHLDGTTEQVRLLPREDSVEGELAQIEFDGGDVQARSIVFDQTTYACRLEKDVRVRLRARGEDPSASRTIFADVADIVFHPGFRASREQESDAGAMARLDAIQKLEVAGREGSRVTVRAQGFELRGDEATWDGNRRVLRFTGRAQPPEIDIAHEEIRGPVRAREIEYDDNARVVRLIGSVEGRLHQPPRAEEDATETDKGRPMVWTFRTSEFDIGLASGTGRRLELVDARARQTVDLESAEKGIKLLGDELFYDHKLGRIRIFSKDGRLQTLMREHRPSQASGAPPPESAGGNAPEVPVDKILAREIFVDLIEPSAESSRADSRARTLLVTFEGEVIASFRLEGLTGPGAPDPSNLWKVESERMTFEVDPDPEGRQGGSITRAIASGGVVASSTAFRGQGSRAEYIAGDRSLRLDGGPEGPAKIDDLRDEKPPLEFSSVLVRRHEDRTEIQPLGTRGAPSRPLPLSERRSGR